MLIDDPKILTRLEPVVRRIMIIDANLAASRLLTDLMKGLGAREVLVEPDDKRAMELAREFEPSLIFVERHGPRLDGEALARRIRRSHLACRQVPIIMVTAEATASNIKGARDAGVHEFMVKPFTAGDLVRRVVNVATKPRNWVEAVGYVGPDRRRFNSGDYKGPKKRSEESAASSPDNFDQLDQARRILVAALDQFDRDPAQALRAISAQSSALKAFAIGKGQTRLAVAAAELESVASTRHATVNLVRGPAVAVLTMIAQLAAETGQAA